MELETNLCPKCKKMPEFEWIEDFFRDTVVWRYVCHRCGIRGNTHENPQKARELWNKIVKEMT